MASASIAPTRPPSQVPQALGSASRAATENFSRATRAGHRRGGRRVGAGGLRASANGPTPHIARPTGDGRGPIGGPLFSVLRAEKDVEGRAGRRRVQGPGEGGFPWAVKVFGDPEPLPEGRGGPSGPPPCQGDLSPGAAGRSLDRWRSRLGGEAPLSVPGPPRSSSFSRFAPKGGGGGTEQEQSFELH